MRYIGWRRKGELIAFAIELGNVAFLSGRNETKMNFEDQKIVLSKLVEVVNRLQTLDIVNPIYRTPQGKFRHVNQTDKVYLFMKAMRYVSLLNSARVLTANGFFQEVGIICRCLTETKDDFFFIAMSNSASNKERREQHLAEFYLEEFKSRTTALLESNKRNRVSRKNIHATIAVSNTTVNPSDATQVLSTLETAYSGYVHGAYGHIMELYGGLEFRFQVNGLPLQAFAGTRERSMSHYVYCGILILECLAYNLGEIKENQGLLTYRKMIEGKWPEFASDPPAALKEAKKRGNKRE